MTTSARVLRYALPLATASLLLSGCGSASPAPGADPPERSGSESGAAEPTPAPGCDVDDPRVLEGPVLATADVDGDGREDAVRQAAASGPCPGELLVVAADRLLTADAPDGPPATEAFVAELDGGTRLLVTRQDHPRGGIQSRLYAESEGRLVELTDDAGNALVPFVATDTSPGTPVSVSCAEGGVIVTEAETDPADPSSIEVTRVTYRIEDGEAVDVGAREVDEDIPADRLRRAYPDLVGNAVLEDCRAG